MVVNKLIEHLTYTGLSDYEARAYYGLLRRHPATAYEMAKEAGLPTSKIYEVVAKLIEKEIITSSESGKGNTYIPMPPEEFIDTRRMMMEATLGELEKGMQGIEQDADVSYIWNIREYGYLMDKTERIIMKAGQTLLLSIWDEEMDRLEKALYAARKRGVQVAVVHFGIPRPHDLMLYQHPIHDTIYTEHGGRGVTVVSDAREALMGTIQKNGEADGAFSTSQGFVTLAADYIKHDIYVMKIVKRFNTQLMQTFGNRYEKLRDVFTDEEIDENIY